MHIYFMVCSSLMNVLCVCQQQTLAPPDVGSYGTLMDFSAAHNLNR